LDYSERLDKILVAQGLFESRTKAEEAVLTGKVKVDSKIICKPGKKIKPDAIIEIDSEITNYVSRGALKLIKALDYFQIDVSKLNCIDLGASTGGFTQVLLERKCKKVYCIDVGTGQLHPRIVGENRVVNFEKTHAKDLTIELIPDLVDLIVIDVSFISLTKVLAYLPPFMKNGAEIVALIKPQFEVGKNHLSKGGIVKDEKLFPLILNQIKNFARSINLEWLNQIESPILGGEGNTEFLCHLRKSTSMNV
jgi:23S rRNA (cytidine1920-2'-O)/16S rRNA (cytidine1409-2'-O)-methyltransferase